MKHLNAAGLGLCASLAVAASAAAQPAGYPTRQQIENQMRAAASNFPAICRFVDLNTTYGTPLTWQGRSIYAVKISDNVNVDEDEESVMIVACHHGNEIGTPVVGLDVISRLTSGYGNDPTITAMVDTHEIWVAPLWNTDGYPSSRHNRRPGSTVDLNRNYPFLWSSPCNTGVKGPGPASEPETQTMLAWSEDQRFDKVLDFHSSGRETLYGYRQGCPNHQLLSYLRAEAVALSTASSYGGQVRGPSSNGEHYHWQLGNFSNYAFLTEIGSSQSPSYSSAVQEAARLWPGTMWFIQRPVPVWGHVTDATSGAPIQANISYLENPFTQGERNRSEPLYGRYHAFLPSGTHTIRFENPCYVTKDVQVTVNGSGLQVEVALTRGPGFVPSSVTVRNGTGVNPLCLTAANNPVLGQVWKLQTDHSAYPTANTVAVLSTMLPGNGPMLPFGQVLLDFNSPLLVLQLMGTGTNPTTFGIQLPSDPAALGFTASAQSVISTGDVGLTLCNALDYTIGCQ